MTLLPTFVVELKSKFQLEVNEKKFVLFSIKVHGPPKINWRTFKGSVDPRLRTAVLMETQSPLSDERTELLFKT